MGVAPAHRAKALSRRLTDTERRLWYSRRANQLDGVKFRRQHLIEPYVVDFVSHAPRLIVEVDGSHRATHMALDNQREAYLRGERIEGLRLWNPQVLTQTERCSKLFACK